MNGTWRALMSLMLLFHHPLFLQLFHSIAQPACNNLSFLTFFISTKKVICPCQRGDRMQVCMLVQGKEVFFVYLFHQFSAFSSVKAQVRVNLLSTELEIQHPADESLSTDSWLKQMVKEQTSSQGAAGYLEEGLLHSEAGQQNWWAMSSSSSSLPTKGRMSREGQRKTEIQTHKMDE